MLKQKLARLGPLRPAAAVPTEGMNARGEEPVARVGEARPAVDSRETAPVAPSGPPTVTTPAQGTAAERVRRQLSLLPPGRFAAPTAPPARAPDAGEAPGLQPRARTDRPQLPV